MKIRNRLILAFLLIAIIPILTIGILSFVDGKAAIKIQELSALEAAIESRIETLDLHLKRRVEEIQMFASKNALKKIIIGKQQLGNGEKKDKENLNQLMSEFENIEVKEYVGIATYYDFIVIGKNGRVVYATEHQLIDKNFQHDPRFIRGMKENYHSKIFTDTTTNKGAISTIVNVPPPGGIGEPIGVVIATMGTTVINKIFNNKIGIGRTFEALLAQREGEKVEFITKLKYRETSPIIYLGGDVDLPIQEAVSGENKSGISIDYRGKEVLYVSKYIPFMNWGVVAKMDTSEAYEPIYDLRKKTLFISLILLLISIVIAVFFSRLFSLPIQKLVTAFNKMGRGELQEKIEIKNKDELGVLARVFNTISTNTTSLAKAAVEIGKGNYEVSIPIRSSEDVLGNSITNMKFNLIEFNRLNNEKQWLQKGESEINKLITGDKTIKVISENAINQIVPYIKAQVAALYIYNEEEGMLQFTAGYAFKKKENKNYDLELGEGLAGQAAKDQKTILFTDIPQEYLTLYSVLGETIPKNIIAVPFVKNNNLIGVMEIASVKEISSLQQELLENISENIAIAIETSINKQKIQSLLKESQTFNEELQASDEELRSQQEEIEKVKVELEQQIACLNEAAIVSETDEHGNITFVNDNFCEISGYSRRELIGKNHRILKSGKQSDALFVGMWKAISLGKIWQGEILNKKKNPKEYYWAETTIMPFKNPEGEIIKYVAIRFDITEEKEQQLALKEQAHELQSQAEELRVNQEELENKAEELTLTSKYKSEFLANMSHELRTPLNSILLLSKLLAENNSGNLDKEQIEFASVIHNSGNGLLELINDILDLSKIEAGKMDVEFEEVDLQNLIDNLGSLFKPIANEKKINYVSSIATAQISSIKTDRIRLEQILKNFLSNALKFTEKGEVKIKVFIAPKRMKFNTPTLQPGEVIAYSVSDTGIGIPSDKQTLVFEAFQQVDGSTRRQFGGTGLGLSISRQIAEMLGGEIHLESIEGEGSTFTLYLPIDTSTIVTDKSNKNVPSKENKEVENKIIQEDKDVIGTTPVEIIDERDNLKSNVLSHKKVLLVDDDIRNIFSLTKILENQNMVVLSANDGKEALEVLKKNSKLDIILMDMMMPEMDGYDTMKVIRKEKKWSKIPMIAVTAKAMLGDRKKCIEAGASGYISKPVDADQLISLLRLWLHKK